MHQFWQLTANDCTNTDPDIKSEIALLPLEAAMTIGQNAQ